MKIYLQNLQNKLFLGELWHITDTQSSPFVFYDSIIVFHAKWLVIFLIMCMIKINDRLFFSRDCHEKEISTYNSRFVFAYSYPPAARRALCKAFDEAQLKTTAKTLITEFNDGNYQAIIDEGSPLMQSSLTLEQWESAVAPYKSKSGAFKSIEKGAACRSKG